MITELKAFTYKLTPMRRIQYQAPEGMHDDCVVSLGLSIWEADLYRKYVPEKEPANMYRPFQISTDSNLSG